MRNTTYPYTTVSLEKIAEEANKFILVVTTDKGINYLKEVVRSTWENDFESFPYEYPFTSMDDNCQFIKTLVKILKLEPTD